MVIKYARTLFDQPPTLKRCQRLASMLGMLALFLLTPQVMNLATEAIANQNPTLDLSPPILSDQLPALGDRISAISRPERENALGQAWLRRLRQKASLIYDPLLIDYLYTLTSELASHSSLQNDPLTLVLVNSAQINAFAVPGGVIGFNAGLFLHTESEAELASVIAHELAHLSQRHYARNQELAKYGQLKYMAALLAGVAAIAAGAGDAGVATLATTAALSRENQLRYSRAHEREADRIGMLTLAKAGIDPNAMPSFFEKLHNQRRFAGDLPPEFLLTHPVTQSRLSDSRTRAAQFQRQRRKAEPMHQVSEFKLMQARVVSAYQSDVEKNIERFIAQLKDQEAVEDENNDTNEQKSTLPRLTPLNAPHFYGLAQAYLKANRYKAAQQQIKTLRQAYPNQITFVVTEAEILYAMGAYAQAEALLEQFQALNPGNQPLEIMMAKSYLQSEQPEAALIKLEQSINRHPESRQNPTVWRLMAQARGQAGQRIAAHQAKAEYHFLHGRNNEAIQQLTFAADRAKGQVLLQQRIQQRVEEIEVADEVWR